MADVENESSAKSGESTMYPQSTLLMPGESTANEPPPARAISRAETAAYATALLVNIVDQMGPQFVSPVLVTYGQEIGANTITLSLFQTARGISAMLSNIWMPVLSDRCGRKWVAFLSVCGVSLGYFIQAMSQSFVDPDPLIKPANWGPACICFIIGRFTTGFFSGMQPVLQAYIAELSSPDPDLITQRIVMVQVAANVGGIAVSPLSGLLAGAFGLQVPFFTVTAIGVFSMLIVPIYFKEVKDIRTDLSPVDPGGISLQLPKKGDASSSARELLVAQPGREEGNPVFDKVIMLMFLSYICLMVMVNGITVFLTPILFQQESFGIAGGPWEDNPTPSEFKMHVSEKIGIVNIPIGMFQVIVAIIFFVPVTKKFGEVPTLIVMGLIGTICFPIVGFCQKVWQVAIVFSFLGMSFGFLTPALGPVGARYGRALYPKQMALVQGIPLVGMQLSNAFATNLLAPIVGVDLEAPDVLQRIRYAYFVVAGFACLFTLTFAGAASLSAQRISALRLAGDLVPDNDDEEDDGLGSSILNRSISDSRVALPSANLIKRSISGAQGRGEMSDGRRSNEASVVGSNFASIISVPASQRAS